MKTRFVLAIVFLCLLNCASAQTVQTCIAENFSSQTAGWTFSQGLNVGNYPNPVEGCAEDRGIITPGVGGNNPCNIKTPEFISTGALMVDLTFDIIVLNANLKCNTWKNYPCPTSVDVFYYVGGTKYTGIIDQLLPPNGPGNSISVSISFNPGNNLPSGTSYKIELCFKPRSGTGNCIQQNTKYVIDNFRNCETSERDEVVRMERSSNTVTTPGNTTAPTLTVSPNPTKGATKITANADADTKTISLMDSKGSLLRSVTGTAFIVFDIKGLKAGKYYVQFENKNGDQVRKLVIIN